MSLKSSMSKRVAQAIAGAKGVLGHLLNDERVLQFIADRPKVLLRILKASEDLPKALDGVDDDFILTYLKRKIDSGALSVKEFLARFDPQLLLKHLGPEQLVENLGAQSLLEHIGPGLLLEKVGPDHLMEGVGAEALMKHIGAASLLQFIGHGPLLRFIEADELADYLGPDRIARHLSGVRLLQALGPRLLSVIAPDQLAEFLGSERLLKHIGEKLLLDRIGPGDLLRRLEPDDLAEYLGADRLLKHLGPEIVLENIDIKRIVEHFGVEELLQHINPCDPLVLGSVIENDDAFGQLMDDERAIRKVFLNETLKRRFRFINAQAIAAALPYRLPGVIVSYPRSGSNFVQSVLRHSSGLSNLSIYGANPDGMDITLSLKSHAPSPEYLRDEFGRIVEDPAWPARIVLVQRDPRDVMISFYEYTQFMRQTTISQKDFLKNTCFFYASSIDPESKRQVDRAPMSVLQAYKKHVQQWFAERPDTVECLIVKYEDLVTAPEETFKGLFNYLNLDCPLAKEFLSLEVSLYDDTREHRAGVATWKRHADKYRVLLSAVDKTLDDEMGLLGY